jgi:hypothetical protein
LLRGDDLRAGELPVALVVGVGLAECGLGRGDRGLRGAGLGSGGLELSHGLAGTLPRAHGRLRAPKVGLGLIQAHQEVALVEDDERVSRLHVLVLFDRHPIDEAGDPRRDAGDVAVHLGVVGAHVVAAPEIPSHAPGGESDDQQQAQDEWNAARPAPALGLGRGRHIHRDVGCHDRSRRAEARANAVDR